VLSPAGVVVAAGVIGAFQAGRGFFGSLLRQGGPEQAASSNWQREKDIADAEADSPDADTRS